MKYANWLFAVPTLLAVMLAGDNLSMVSAQGSDSWAIAQAQRAVRQQVTNQEGGRGSTVTFNSNTQTELRSNGAVRVSGTGAFANNNNSRNNNARSRDFTVGNHAVTRKIQRAARLVLARVGAHATATD